MNKEEYLSLSKEIRILSLRMAHDARASHTGGALSMVDLLTVLYGGRYIRITPDTVDDPNRDRFILSKGHCCASLYATLACNGYIDPELLLKSYGQNGAIYYTHTSHLIKGVEASTGSLGHGLPIASGLALSSRMSGRNYNVYCITGDGEMDEGSIWETLLFAGNHHLSNLCLIIDYNKLQSMGDVKDIDDLAPLADKLKAFKWNTLEIDGHDFGQIEKAYQAFSVEKDRPTAIIANTIKGKGVSFMENDILWHYRNPDDEQLKQALEELK